MIVEAGDGDPEILVVKLGEEFRQDGEGIGDCAAINTGVEVALRAGQFDLIVIQAAQSVSDGGDAFPQHGRIGNQERIGLQLLFIFLDKVPEADAADFFFSFDQDLHVDGKLAIGFL